MKHIFPIFIIIFAIILPIACERVIEDVPALSEDDYYSFILGTKAGSPSSRTYRVLLHKKDKDNENDIKYPYLDNSGTYRERLLGDTIWLAPCRVDSRGVYLSDGHIGGLRATANTYKISFVSPARAPYPYDTISFTPQSKLFQWGYRLSRDDSENFYISTPVTMKLDGNHIGDKQVYDVSDTTILRERRAKIKLVAKCGDKLNRAEIYKVGWTGLFTEAYFNIGRDTLERLTPQNPNDTVYCLNQVSPLVLNRNESAVIDDCFYVFALDYGKEGEDHRKIYSSTPKLHITTIGSKTLSIDMAQNFQEQYIYTMNVTINTAFVQIDVSASPWAEEPEQSAAISDEDSIISSFSWSFPAAWQDGGTSNGIIGDDES